MLFPLLLTAQFVPPPASPPAKNEVQIGYTKAEVSYHRPGVRGRKVFGELLPWNEVWRAGANENTLVTFDGEVYIGDTKVPAGTYSLYLIPSEFDEWTWIVNKATENWGARGYNQNLDVARVRAKPTDLSEREETLGYRWRNVRPGSAELTFEWEWKRLPLRIAVMTNQEVISRTKTDLNPAKDPKEYYAAARYYLDNGLDLKQAKTWMDRWAKEGKEQFGRMRYQAIIEHELGNEVDAERLMRRSLELARMADNDHYVRMNQQSLKDWSRVAIDMTADSLLTRAIRYHDPENKWGSRLHLLQVAESRPGGIVRHSRLSLYPNGEDFDLQQVRGKDKIQMRYVDGTYSFSHQGKTEVSELEQSRLSLTRERTQMLRDYYTYLWGLPMKLRDPGTLVQPTVHRVWFNEEEVLELEVHYAPETGKDRWFFYFNPNTYALTGYSFYKEENGPGTGEYIILKDEAVVDKMRLPAERHWYETMNNLYLGSDEILR